MGTEEDWRSCSCTSESFASPHIDLMREAQAILDPSAEQELRTPGMGRGGDTNLLSEEKVVEAAC